jgi:DNA-binding GntR family transcriptional regulator
MGRNSSNLAKARTPLREKVYKTLEERIIYGALEPGHHLVETEIANKAGISRIPVREALQLLSRAGWVDLLPDMGAFVHTPTVEEVEDTFKVRVLLEAESARLAAQNATDESTKTLKEIVREGKKALRAGDERKLILLNSQFHSTITKIAGNSVLEGLIASLDKRIRWYFAPVAKVRGLESWKEHAEVLDAIIAGDEARAAEVMRKHAELTREAHEAHRSLT